jgi:hypothetical protein
MQFSLHRHWPRLVHLPTRSSLIRWVHH